MPRLRLPRLPFLGRRDDDRPERDEHERLVLIAEVAGFVVVTSIIATFVLMVANSSGGQAAAPNPEVPTITDAGGPAATDVEPAPLREPAKAIQPPAVGERAEAVKPKPKPKPKPSPTSPSPAPRPQVVFADHYDRCAQEGARAYTERLHIPLECRGGRWHYADFGDDDDDDGYGDDDDHGNGPGNGHGHGR
jgi:hypothetical protein